MGRKAITEATIAAIRAEHGRFKRVLDLGCGDQCYKSLLDFDQYIGIDVEVSGHPNEEKVVDVYFDGKTVPFPDETFDFILCTEVFEHALEPESLAREMKRVLRRDGIVLLTVPSMWGEHETPYDFRRYTSFGIQKLADDVGLEVLEFCKEKSGPSALIYLGLSEVTASSNSPLVKRLSNLWLYASFVILVKILRVEMPRIYLTNVVLLGARDLQT